jgi:hypothetical protein
MANIYAFMKPVVQPAMRIIVAITNANPAVVTTSFAHQYLNGLIVRLNVPYYFGMSQIDKLSGAITIIDDLNFSIPIDSILFNPFVVPTMTNNTGQLANVVSYGELTSQTNGSTQNVLPYPLSPGTYWKQP